MGIEKKHIPGRFDAPEVEHIDSVRFSRWPNLTRSEALRLIVMEHRLLTAAGILAYPNEVAQQVRCLQIVPLQVVDSARGRNGEGVAKDYTQGERA